jgi:hypothetical protein
MDMARTVSWFEVFLKVIFQSPQRCVERFVVNEAIAKAQVAKIAAVKMVNPVPPHDVDTPH